MSSSIPGGNTSAEHTKEPWSYVTHERRGTVYLLPLANYYRAEACVNALADKNPEALGRVVEAARSAELWINNLPLNHNTNEVLGELRAALADLEATP